MAKKRANGEGNIRKRSDGRWEGRYTAGYDPDTGKRIIKNVLAKTQAEAKDKLSKAIEEAKGLDIAHSGDCTVSAWLHTWYELYAQPNIRLATANRYELMMNVYTIPRIGAIKLSKLTSRDLQRTCRKTAGLTPRPRAGPASAVPRSAASTSCSTAPSSGR